MDKKSELTRISNFIEKEVSVESIEEMYDALIHLDRVLDHAKKGSDKILAYLKENNIRPEKYYPEEGKKIIFQEGRAKTVIDPYRLRDKLSEEDFLKVVTVNETLLKKLNGGIVIVAELKEEVGKAKDSILVKKMTKEELKEMKK